MSYFIRCACLSDVHALAILGSSSPSSGFTENEIRARIQVFAAGQFVLCTPSGKVTGCLYTQRIVSTSAILEGAATVANALALHKDSGPVWQLVSLQVAHGLVSPGLASHVLIDFFLTVARACASVCQVVAISRWTQVDEEGGNPDPSFLTARGARTTALVARARPKEVDHAEKVIVIEYNLASFRLVHETLFAVHSQVMHTSIGALKFSGNTHTALAKRLQREVKDAVCSFLKKEVDYDTPLMDAGLDSHMMQSFVQASARPRAEACFEWLSSPPCESGLLTPQECDLRETDDLTCTQLQLIAHHWPIGLACLRVYLACLS